MLAKVGYDVTAKWPSIENGHELSLTASRPFLEIKGECQPFDWSKTKHVVCCYGDNMLWEFK